MGNILALTPKIERLLRDCYMAWLEVIMSTKPRWTPPKFLQRVLVQTFFFFLFPAFRRKSARLDFPFKFQKTCPDFSIYPQASAGISGFLDSSGIACTNAKKPAAKLIHRECQWLMVSVTVACRHKFVLMNPSIPSWPSKRG